jgi:hypothetical protein
MWSILPSLRIATFDLVMDKVFEYLLSQGGLIGAFLFISLTVNGFLYREGRARELASAKEREAWAKALQDINDKRLAENREAVMALDRNSAILAATNESSQARTAAFEQLSRGQAIMSSEISGGISQAKEQRDRLERNQEALKQMVENLRVRT